MIKALLQNEQGFFLSDHRILFVSHRAHRGHGGLIWIAERAIQIKVPSCYRRKEFCRRLIVWPDFFLSKNQAKFKNYLCDPCPTDGRRVCELKRLKGAGERIS